MRSRSLTVILMAALKCLSLAHNIRKVAFLMAVPLSLSLSLMSPAPFLARSLWLALVLSPFGCFVAGFPVFSCCTWRFLFFWPLWHFFLAAAEKPRHSLPPSTPDRFLAKRVVLKIVYDRIADAVHFPLGKSQTHFHLSVFCFFLAVSSALLRLLLLAVPD